MKINYRHKLTQEEAYKRIDNLLIDLQKEYDGKIINPRTIWNPEHTRMEYTMKILGFSAKGEITLKKNQISLREEFPFVAGILGGKIKEMVTKQKQLDDLLS